MQKVWGDDTHITERSVDTLVKRVRRKIEDDPAEPLFVLTVWGTGYKFADVLMSTQSGIAASTGASPSASSPCLRSCCSRREFCSCG